MLDTIFIIGTLLVIGVVIFTPKKNEKLREICIITYFLFLLCGGAILQVSDFWQAIKYKIQNKITTEEMYCNDLKITSGKEREDLVKEIKKKGYKCDILSMIKSAQALKEEDWYKKILDEKPSTAKLIERLNQEDISYFTQLMKDYPEIYFNYELQEENKIKTDTQNEKIPMAKPGQSI